MTDMIRVGGLNLKHGYGGQRWLSGMNTMGNYHVQLRKRTHHHYGQTAYAFFARPRDEHHPLADFLNVINVPCPGTMSGGFVECGGADVVGKQYVGHIGAVRVEVRHEKSPRKNDAHYKVYFEDSEKGKELMDAMGIVDKRKQKEEQAA